MFGDSGNKCGKCQNHEFEVLKKGHARDCPFKKCDCLKCRLLDARSDILQVISGKETRLKGTKKDPNCGFCQNHGIKILRKGHVRSCGFGQERHFKLDNCFDCEVHYIRNEVNRLQIKMRRAMKEDKALSEEQRKTAREPITRDEVEKVCDMARLARKKRESMLTQQVGECSTQLTLHSPPPPPPGPGPGPGPAPTQQQQQNLRHHQQVVALTMATSSTSVSPHLRAPIIKEELDLSLAGGRHLSHHSKNNHNQTSGNSVASHQIINPHHQHRQTNNNNNNNHHLNQHNIGIPLNQQQQAFVGAQAGVWRPWSQHQFNVTSLQRHQQHQLANLPATQLPITPTSSLLPVSLPQQPLALTSQQSGSSSGGNAQLREQQVLNTLFRIIFAQFAQPVDTARLPHS